MDGWMELGLDEVCMNSVSVQQRGMDGWMYDVDE